MKKIQEGVLDLTSDYIPYQIRNLLKNLENNLYLAFEEIKETKVLQRETDEMLDNIKDDVYILGDKDSTSDEKFEATFRINDILDIYSHYFKKIFKKASGSVIELDFDYDENRHPILNAYYKENIRVKYVFNIGFFLDVLIKDTKNFIEDILIVFHHELIHSIQYEKHGNDKLPSKVPDYVKSLDTYITTPLEIPAQAQTLASIFYYDSKRNVEDAMENLRSLKLNNKKEGVIGEIYDTIIRNKEKKKVKKIISYAYLNLYAMKELN